MERISQIRKHFQVVQHCSHGIASPSSQYSHRAAPDQTSLAVLNTHSLYKQLTTYSRRAIYHSTDPDLEFDLLGGQRQAPIFRKRGEGLVTRKFTCRASSRSESVPKIWRNIFMCLYMQLYMFLDMYYVFIIVWSSFPIFFCAAPDRNDLLVPSVHRNELCVLS